jgi:hypothetical protein
VKEQSPAGEKPGVRILVIVVLYKMPLTESPTIAGLLQAFSRHPELRDSLSVLIWDNSPTPFRNPELIPSFAYRHSETNVGVSGAYNQAMGIAERMGCQWMLLLDQDTEIPLDFLPQVLRFGCEFLEKIRIAAVLPFLMDGDRVLSPQKVLFKRFKPLERPFEGIYPGEVTAANSGTLIRIEALKQIGGFNEDFWLGYSDAWVFHQLYKQGRQIHIAGDLLLMHKFSAIDFKNAMSPERYLNSIASEGAFWDLCGTASQRAFHTLRTLERGVRQSMHPEKSAYGRITLAYFFRRLLSSKNHRLRWWKLQSRERNIPVFVESSPGRDARTHTSPEG